MRALVGHRLLRAEPVVVVATPAALTAPLLKPADYRARLLRLELGGTMDREALTAGLEGAGYERVEAVMEVGQWSLRGGIVDIFSPSRERPVRPGVLRRRDRVAAPLRSDHPALGGGPSSTSTVLPLVGPTQREDDEPGRAPHPHRVHARRFARGAPRPRRARGATGRRAVRGAAGASCWRSSSAWISSLLAPAGPEAGGFAMGTRSVGGLPRPVQAARG